MRTAIHPDIDGAVGQLAADLETLSAEAARVGFRIVTIGFNPRRENYPIEPPLNSWEMAHRQQSPEDRSAHVHMTTYGPDLNLSWDRLGPDQLIDVGAKLTFYSPYIVPFSFSSPFARGRLWGGLSWRTFVADRGAAGRDGLPRRPHPAAGHRPLAHPAGAHPGRGRSDRVQGLRPVSGPGAVRRAADPADRAADRRHPARPPADPGRRLHQVAARTGHRHPYIRVGAERVLDAVRRALPDAADQARLDSLRRRFDAASCPARDMIEQYRAGETVAGLRAA